MPSQACRNALTGVRREKGSHPGLLLARYLRVPVKEKEHPEDRRELYDAARQACGVAAPVYTLAFKRWDAQLQLQDAVRSLLSVQGRLVIGLGGENVLETGITLHHIYGVPFIPGAALKGLATHYCDQVWGGKDESFKCTGEYYQALFGTTEDSGHIVFYDAWITPESLTPPKGLVLDVMTPHHQDYYAACDAEKAPTDFDDPNPVTFFSVTGSFLVSVSCDVNDERGQKWAKLAATLLSEALEFWGVGGKTNAGYGRLVDSSRTDATTEKAASVSQTPSRPRFKVGERVSAKRVEDPRGRPRVWFQAEDGFGGVVTRGQVPDVQIGETLSLWVAAVSDGYNFSSEAPQQPSPRQGGRSRVR
jgi:CRISPR-associated protein Cmr6